MIYEFGLLSRGKIVLGYTEAELRVRGSGYQFIHAADMLYCAENHVRSKYNKNSHFDPLDVVNTIFSCQLSTVPILDKTYHVVLKDKY